MKTFALPLLLALALLSSAGIAYAQSIPLPPPSPESSPEEVRIAENDRAPPKIEILTPELVEGKNVFRARITDDSSLQIREVKYVHDGQLKVDGLFRDQNDIYKALIDIESPSRIVVVTASDASGNQASAFKEYEVTKSQDVLTQIMDMLSKIPRYFQNLFGLPAPS